MGSLRETFHSVLTTSFRFQEKKCPELKLQAEGALGRAEGSTGGPIPVYATDRVRDLQLLPRDGSNAVDKRSRAGKFGRRS